MMRTIKTCPCCGKTAQEKQIETKTGNKYVWIECKDCGLQTQHYQGSVDYCAKDEAAKVWNRRPLEVVEVEQ